jgi:hypothetical protein
MRLISATLFLVGCYSTHPAIPTINAPALVPSGQLDVQTHTYETGDYYVTSSGAIRKSEYTNGTAEYGGTKLTFAQAQALSDPKWSSKMADLGDRHRTCNRGMYPALVGYGGMVVGGLLGMVVGLKNQNNYEGTLSSTDKVLVAAAFGTFGLGVVSYLAGYAVGGYACAGEGEVRAQLGIDSESTTLSYDEAMLVDKLAREFNRAHAAPE